MFHSSRLRRIFLLVECATLLASPISLPAQTPAVSQTPVQRPAFKPRIKEVNSRDSTQTMPMLLPLQTFSIEGTLFNDAASKNRVMILYPVTSWTPETKAAEIVPSSATTTTLTARIPASVQPGRYMLRVRAGDSGLSNGVLVQVPELDLAGRMGSPRIDAVSPDSGRRGEEIALDGLFRSAPRVFLDPATAGGEPLSLSPFFADGKRIRFRVPPEALQGGYRIAVSSPGMEKRTNALRLRVLEDTASRYVLEIGRIRSIIESADGIGSDEIYAVAVSFLVGKSLESPEEIGTGVFNDVDAGETFNAGNRKRVRMFNGASAPDHLILIALKEYDSSGEDGPEQDRGAEVVRGIGHTISEESRDPKLSSREKLAIFARFTMMRELAKNSSRFQIPSGTSTDELLGLEELRLTQRDLQQAAQLGGAALTRQLVFRGDGSHYVMDVHLRLFR